MTAEALVNAEEGQREELLETIRAARAGDAAAFEEIMIQTERYVAGIAWRILGDAEEVKDAMQETFLRVFRHLHRYDERHDLRAWLTRITVNVCRDRLRARKRSSIFRPLIEALGARTRETPADETLALREAIDALPPKERMALILHDIEGLPTIEVAAALGNAVTTVRVLLSRARARLRRKS